MRQAIFCILVGCAIVSSTSVPAEDTITTDESFERARELAHSGERDAAREECRQLLDRSPDYTDARVLLGRLHAWDKNYVLARDVLAGVVRDRPDNRDARLALADVELWSGRSEAALEVAADGLRRTPDDPELLLRKARALDRLDRGREALLAAQSATMADPALRPARRAYRRLIDEVLPNKVALDSDFEDFDDGTDSWQMTSLSYRRSMGFGSLIGRVNAAQRFDDNGVQFEVDAYPRVAPDSYLFLNAGVSSTDLFPELRYSAEFYHNFERGYEGSAGFRRLEFDSSDVMIYTGTAAKYMGRYWLALRPNYVTKDDGNSTSGSLALRRFFGGRYEYAELVVGGGTESQDDFITQTEDSLDSFKVRFELRRRVSDRMILKGNAGVRSQEFLNDRTRDSFFLGLGIERLF
ncbi:MAG: YaiO family outer membrane beta-barrel protein [bacterium]|nr:YaiO family outer membrane beta-barrel protein [bacterium]